MRYLRKILLVMLFTESHLLFAATEFEGDVPADLVSQMVGGSIYSDLPDEFPDISLPPEINLRASIVNDFSTHVIFSADSGFDEGARLLADSFMDAGWVMLPTIEYQQPENGFIRANTPLPPFSNNDYCHDRFGTLRITPENGNPTGSTINARLSQMAQRQPGFSCQQQIDQREMSADRQDMRMFRQQNREYLPRLELPEDNARPITRMPFSISDASYSSSGGEIETEIQWQGDLNISELNTYFAEQLQAQDWQPDASWVGGRSAGGNWTFSPAPDLNFVGVLNIVNTNDDLYMLKFTMTPVDGVQPQNAPARFFRQ